MQTIQEPARDHGNWTGGWHGCGVVLSKIISPYQLDVKYLQQTLLNQGMVLHFSP